jgi:hypothetical protein
MRLTAAELSVLLEGLDWKRVHAPRQVTVPAVPSWTKKRGAVQQSGRKCLQSMI